MKISINKVSQLKEEPASPKFQKPTKVWGSQNQSKGGGGGKLYPTTTRKSMQNEPCEDRSASAIKARIDRKLSLLFGQSKVTRSQSTSRDKAHSFDRQVSA
jgi:hypothetical protein